ncbi:hypothetical protein JCM17844_02400 [Iodidimonas gelatinilytica]|uniref:General secretion pathway protein GspM n=1 Tax=Iodidimonas gelatinilytica TaxID=1236966 RepID=A0A5A7MVY9_9PROT|nr:type II secretion system protein GspM [Iodidimonas gelatinilytica]GEQ96603.1 hypothetical protein JCM17844_02400 [Iodidimonas gelatinilytica]GER00078.1 hypothetical protein JCM17845_07010 [Iodidimonas gelatinilytica]
MMGSSKTLLHKGLAVLLLLAALLFVYEALVAPIFSGYRAQIEAYDQDKRLLRGYRAVAQSARSVEDLTRQVRAHQAQSGIFLKGLSDALAAARLQTYLGEAISSNEGDVRSVQSLPVDMAEGLSRVRLRVQFLTNIRGLAQLLQQLETGQPAVFVDAVKLRTRLERTEVGADKMAVAQDFLVDLTVSAYRLGEDA